ncbi:MAG TPA: hypothetical protein VIC27_11505, partial [Ktedonobacterales bacterium]
WLACALAAFLRLWHIELSQFLEDQRNFAYLAREALLHHALLISSVTYSIGVYSPPLSAYLLMPFAAFTANPLPAVVFIALWNVLGVAVGYVFALRAFGRRIAAVAALLFATSSVAVNYSRFIWQPPFWPTLFAFWALTLYAGAVHGKRHWLAANVTLLALAALLHPVALVLAPVTLLAIFLAPRWPSRADYFVTAALLVLLLVPSALFELVSHGLNLHLYTRTFLKGGGHFGLTVFHDLYLLLGAPGNGDFGPQSPYAGFAGVSLLLNLVVALLFAAGYIVLTWAVVRPAIACWRAGQRTPSWQSARGWARAVWRGLRADAAWRGNLFLWLWMTLPPLSMIRYSSPPTVHYLLVLFPGAFVVAALGARALFAQAPQLLALFVPARAGGESSSARRFPSGARLARAALVVALALLIAAQTLQSALYAGSLAAGQFTAYNFYGYPLGEMQAADAQITALQRQQGVSGVYVVEPAQDRFAIGMEYLLVGEHADRTGFQANCLVLPAPQAGSALVVVTAPNTPAANLLAAMPEAQPGGQISLAGGTPFPVYRVAGTPPLLPGEQPVAPVSFTDATGEGV